MVRMQVYKIGMDPQRRPLVLLADEEGKRLLPIWIGPFEAHAIASELKGQVYPRPLTHDLLRSVIETLGYSLERVEITHLQDHTFYALLHLQGPVGQVEIDSRPSDAIALALRTKTPLYVAEEVLDQAQFLSDEAEAEETEKFRELLGNMTPEVEEPGLEEDLGG